ncbi:MAG: peptidase S53, partial [Mycobacteriaceae bacterium]|nr:peptidase S53 [Mycobacteriaceae bacterium]
MTAPLLRLLAVLAVLLAADLRTPPAHGAADIGGPFALLLAGSTDLGLSHRPDAQLTAALRGTTRPQTLLNWAHRRGLSVRWRPGDSWAIVAGASTDLASAFDVEVRDYRGRKGQVF